MSEVFGIECAIDYKCLPYSGLGAIAEACQGSQYLASTARQPWESCFK